MGYLTKFSLYGVPRDNCWCYWGSQGHSLTHLLVFHSSWYVCCYLMLHCIRKGSSHWYSCGMDSHRTLGCGNTTRNQQG